MILARTGNVLHQFAPIAPVKFGATFTRRTDKCDCKPRVICHRNERCLAITRMTFEADLLSVHGLIGFEIIKRAAGAPGPGTQCTPIIQVAWLTFVDETNDPLR